MNAILEQISERVHAAGGKKDFIDLVFRHHKQKVLNGDPVVLFGAGELGNELNRALRHNNIRPVCFCDNDYSKSGTVYSDIPVISFDDLVKYHKDSLILIAIANERHLESIERQLLLNGFSAERILCNKDDLGDDLHFIHMYANNCSISPYGHQYSSQSLLHVLHESQQDILDAYNLMADTKSKELFISKLALLASNEHYELFKNFMSNHSEPIHVFGLETRHRESEEYFYFNNDIIQLVPNEIYVDVGAADGDTVHPFIEACNKYSACYKWIYALEPDPNNYRELIKSTSSYRNISCHQLGLWSVTKTLRFLSSDHANTKEAASLRDDGDIEVDVVSLDDFLIGKEVTFIKMDPPGNIIPEAIKGAADSIAKYKPKLALGAYHTIASIFEIPLLVNNICPDYKFYLRHNTCHMFDTVLYAIV